MERTTAEWETIIEFLRETDDDMEKQFNYYDRIGRTPQETEEFRRKTDKLGYQGVVVRELLAQAEENRSEAFHRENWS